MTITFPGYRPPPFISVSVRPSVCLSVCFHSMFRTDWPLALIFCTCVGHYHGSQRIETEGHRSRLVWLRRAVSEKIGDRGEGNSRLFYKFGHWRRARWVSREENLRPPNFIGLNIYFNSLGQICIPTSGLSACVVTVSVFLGRVFFRNPIGRNEHQISSTDGRGRERCIIVPNFVKICQSVAGISQFFDFSRRRPNHLRFQKLSTFIGCHDPKGRDASSCQI